MEESTAQQAQLEEEKREKEERASFIARHLQLRRAAHAPSTYESNDETQHHASDKKNNDEGNNLDLPAPALEINQTHLTPPPPPPRVKPLQANNLLPADAKGHEAFTDDAQRQHDVLIMEPVEAPQQVEARTNNPNEFSGQRPRRLFNASNDDSPETIMHPASLHTANTLLKMENLLILINVWRDSEFGKKILQERGVIISKELREEMNEQWHRLRSDIKKLELCIVQLFSNWKHGHDIDDSKLNEIISKISNLSDPRLKRFSNTVGNINNDEPVANNICLPSQLFSKKYSDAHTIDNVKFNIRRHIIYKHKFYFEKYDESVLRKESPNTSAQHASYNIQSELVNIAQDAGILDKACAIESADHEGIQNLVTGIIGRQIGLAGSIPVWFKEDSYCAKTLNIIARYNNHIDGKNKTLPLEKLFMRNPLSRFNYHFDNLAPDNRSASEKRQSLITILLMLSNYYLKKPLGEYFADSLGIDVNSQFGQKARIKKLKRLAEQLAFAPQNDDVVINLLLKEIKVVINSFWSSNTRTKNELILLVQHFGSANDKKDLPKLSKNPKRFCNDKEVFDYQIDKAHADEFYKLHFSQEMMKKLSHYHAATSKRRSVSTAVCKDQAMWELEQGLNEIYLNPSEIIQKQIDALPIEYSHDLAGLINYKIKHIYLATMSDRIVAIQSEFSRTWHKLNQYFTRMIFGTIQQNTINSIRFVEENRANADSSTEPAAQQNQLVSNPDFYVLAARLLAIINAYCDSDLAHDMKLEINYYSSGHKKRAENLANFVTELFLKINQNARDKADQEANALKQLKQEIERVSLLIKDPFIKGSPKSRFAKSLDELINAKHISVSAKSLPFNAAKSVRLFPDDKIDDAKRMIHRHMIDQVCMHYVDFEKDIQGRWIHQPGEFQQKVVADTRKRLMTISYMSLADQNKEIAKLAAQKNIQTANMRDLIIDTVGKPIIHCGRIVFGFSNHLANMLKKVCKTINNFLIVDKKNQYIQTLLVPNQVERCIGLVDDGEAHNHYVNMFRLLASVQIIGKYYLDDTLGKQYADAINVPYNEIHGWNEKVNQLLQLAENLYIRRKPDGEDNDDYAKRTMTEILNPINSLINEIKQSFSKNSRLANELISLMTRYGGACRLHTAHNLNDTRFKENSFLVEPRKLSRDQAEDFMQMNYIQQVSSIVCRLKIGLDRRDSVATAESATLLQMEQNLDNLYKMTIGERRAEMEKLPANKRNITNLTIKYLQQNIPYDFMSHKSYLAKTVVHRLLYEIREKIESANKPAVIVPNDVRPRVPVH